MDAPPECSTHRLKSRPFYQINQAYRNDLPPARVVWVRPDVRASPRQARRKTGGLCVREQWRLDHCFSTTVLLNYDFEDGPQQAEGIDLSPRPATDLATSRYLVLRLCLEVACVVALVQLA